MLKRTIIIATIVLMIGIVCMIGVCVVIQYFNNKEVVNEKINIMSGVELNKYKVNKNTEKESESESWCDVNFFDNNMYNYSDVYEKVRNEISKIYEARSEINDEFKGVVNMLENKSNDKSVQPELTRVYDIESRTIQEASDESTNTELNAESVVRVLQTRYVSSEADNNVIYQIDNVEVIIMIIFLSFFLLLIYLPSALSSKPSFRKKI